ncbi:MAG TPA: hypothetical protein VJT84_07080 [Gaiellaceae bacterium]|nr:hypothetical protein [Gaiellaceae bacterium]
MLRRLALAGTALVAAVLALAATALAGGASPGLVQGSRGVTLPGQPLRYVTFGSGETTAVAAVIKGSGTIARWRPFAGQWGIPAVTFDGAADGLTRDGRTLVLADWTQPENSALRSVSQFRLLDTRTFLPKQTIELKGDFSFDAFSPNGNTLYLIQHVSEQDVMRYLVRAFDLNAQRLLPKIVADRRQADWVMRGFPMKRATSADGRWVYTLYRQDGGYPFVHALDAANRTAVCIGVPWTGSQDPLAGAELRLDERHGKLTISAAARQVAIDTQTFRVSIPKPGGDGFPSGLVAGLAAGVFVLTALVTLTLLARRRNRARLNPPIEGLPA